MGAAKETEGAQTLRAAVAVCLLGLFWTLPMGNASAWGWDESMHSELPAVRVLLGATSGEWRSVSDAIHGCNQYPFVWPLCLALVQAVFGVSEFACRVAGTWIWCFGLLGLFELTRAVVARRRGGGAARRGDDLAPWLALGLGALSPLPLAYSGTLFLEVPFAAGAVWALRAWVRRDGGARRDLAAGAWLAVAFFTKFNYGLMLGAGCAAAWILEGGAALRAGRVGPWLKAGAGLAAVPALAFAWWFLLPFPEGAETAARHRAAFGSFLGGNRDMVPTPAGVRILHWACFFSFSARLLAVQLAGVIVTLRGALRPELRVLWLSLAAMTVPLWSHPFHLDRFLIPAGPALWALAALGLARLLPSGARWRAVCLGGAAAAVFSYPEHDARTLSQTTRLAATAPAVRALQLDTFRGWRNLTAGRPLPTAGLAREEHDALSDLVASEVAATERVGWLGLSSGYSPAAIHLALLERGGPPERLLRDAHRTMDVTFEGVDPGWDDERLAAWAAEFDVILFTDPPDLRARRARAFISDYQRRLVANLGWPHEVLGSVELSRRRPEPLSVKVYACRPPIR
ncbi:MAG: hypothetical protein CMJ84_05460 [Planctomycetes bacterium]|jgi:hypothetical protein|nr:hypothetical protein [Planctomycetota bacterium]MDP6410361.1 hypothetical protein [Planctomycetota bacterium]